MKDNNYKFLHLREKYSNFIYDNYEIYEADEYILLKYNFTIQGLVTFSPTIKLLKKNFNFCKIDNNIKNLAFNLGLIELISYWKAVCSENIIVKCGDLNNDQIDWFKKLYFYGLGEFFYTNNIKTDIENFVNIKCTGKSIEIKDREASKDEYIIPIGGGKDSAVTLELLKNYRKQSYAFIVNPKETTLKCANIAGFENDRIIEVQRIIDKKLLVLNSAGFINGHTPFSAMLAFLTYLVASLMNVKYITLSNESSANEPNIGGEKINHQYSKSYEFENDFKRYSEKYLKSDVLYFSLLRPFSEIQIAKLFSENDKYYRTIKSCNVGSKTTPWKWCNNCPKCLFVYIMLSAFWDKEKVTKMFGEDLLDKESLKETFLELCGYGKNKPFECVGTYDEVRYAVSKIIEKNEYENLPVLLKHYKENYKLNNNNGLLKEFDENNNLPIDLKNILKRKIEEW